MKKTSLVKRGIITALALVSVLGVCGLTVLADPVSQINSKGIITSDNGTDDPADDIVFDARDLQYLETEILNTENTVLTLEATVQAIQEAGNPMTLKVSTIESDNVVGSGWINFTVPAMDGYEPLIIVYGGITSSNWGSIQTVSQVCNGPGTYSFYFYNGNAQRHRANVIYSYVG